MHSEHFPALLAAYQMGPSDALDLIDLLPVLATMFVAAPLAIAFARLIWKRGTVAPLPSGTEQTVQEQLAQLRQAVDTMAVEIERVSESQRFFTKLLMDKERGALALGEAARQAEPPSKPAQP